jgi:predicted permease
MIAFLWKLEAKNEFAVLLAFQNSGYVPLIMVTTLFEGEVSSTLYLNIFLMLIGFNALMWTWGVMMITGRTAKKFDPQSIVNAPLVALVTCLFLIFTGANTYVPIIFLKPLKMLGACVLPMAMLVIGGNLGRTELTKIKKEVVWVVVGKLLIMPALGILAILWFKPNPFLSFLLLIETAAPSATTSSIIARHYRVKDQILNQGIFYTHILCLITMPLFLYIYSRLMGI